MRIILIAALLLATFVVHAQSGNTRSLVPADVRQAAKKLATAWIETVTPSEANSLAQRSIAFAGLVPNLDVQLDGKRFSIRQALCDSGVTLLGNHDVVADAGAIRNIVYTLNEIAQGRVFPSERRASLGIRKAI
jgi:hypothetical protein